MSRMQMLAEPPFLLLQARDFLVEARRLKPGAARNELRETAKVLRELAKREEESAGGCEPARRAIEFDRLPGRSEIHLARCYRPIQ